MDCVACGVLYGASVVCVIGLRRRTTAAGHLFRKELEMKTLTFIIFTMCAALWPIAYELVGLWALAIPVVAIVVAFTMLKTLPQRDNYNF